MSRRQGVRKQAGEETWVDLRVNPDPRPDLDVSDQERDEALSEIKLISGLAQELLNVRPTLALATQLDNNNKLKVLRTVEALLVPIYMHWDPKGQPFRYKVNDVIWIRCDKTGWNIEHKRNTDKTDDSFDYSQHVYIVHQINVMEMWDQLTRWYRFMTQVHLKEKIVEEHTQLMQQVHELIQSNTTSDYLFEKLKVGV